MKRTNTVVAPNVQKASFLQLPPELLEDVLLYLDDRTQLVQAALVCRALHDVAVTTLYRWAVRIDTIGAAVSFCEAATASRRYAFTVRVLEINLREGQDECVVCNLGRALGYLQNLRALTVCLSDVSPEVSCANSALLNVRLQALTKFTTSIPASRDLLRFLRAHGAITELSLSDSGGTLDNDKPVSLPSLKTLQCGGGWTRVLSVSPTLTTLSLTSCNLEELALVAEAVGKSLTCLELSSPVFVLRENEDGPTPWTLQDILSRFSSLEVLQVQVDSLRLESSVLNIMAPATPPLRISRHAPLSMSWKIGAVLTDAYARRPGQLRSCLNGLASHVLQEWAPCVDKI
ncbi:hypothetical protein BD413DRAFT_616960 [Trametes elegans]|nr:hypothetical protein BD413DRAFT_616960 [Trametes elegans]